jgi:lipopolysaccharide export system permease protein
MLRTLTTYVLRELFWPLVVTCALMVLVGTTAQLVRLAGEISGVGLSLGDLVGALPFALPIFFGKGLPVAFLVAIMVAFGRMAEERELLALAASGVSMRRLLSVPLLMGVLLTGVGLSMTLYFEPLSVVELRARMVNSAATYFSRTLEPQVIHDQMHGFMIYFGQREDDGEIRDVLIADEREADHPRLITAQYGRIDASGVRLSLLLRHGEIQIRDGVGASFRRVTFEELDWHLDIEYFLRRAVGAIPLANAMSLAELHAKSQVGTQIERDWHLWTLHRKFTYPLANLIFVLLVFPVTTVLSQRSRLLAYAGAATMVGFYFTMAEATPTLQKLFGLSGAMATWMPNIVFGLLGLTMTYLRVRR